MCLCSATSLRLICFWFLVFKYYKRISFCNYQMTNLNCVCCSNFSEIFDVDWFIKYLSKDVKIIKELPSKKGKTGTPFTMRVPRKCNERCYQIRLLPVFLKRHVSLKFSKSKTFTVHFSVDSFSSSLYKLHVLSF